MNESDKIFWYSFIRQLKELYFLLFTQKYISCGIDEFMSHFTGKKWKNEFQTSEKEIKWNSDKYLLILLINYLTEKGFLKTGSDLKKHFDNIGKSAVSEYTKNKNTTKAKKLRKKLETLFPETTGLRCKQRLYYRYRNKESMSSVLQNCGIDIKINSNK